METRKAFVYRGKSRRPAKRRRLIVEDDFSTSLEMRKQACKESWARVEQGINRVLDDTNNTTIAQLDDFISATSQLGHSDRLPVGVVSSVQGSTSCANLFRRLQESNSRPDTVFACLSGADCSNFKTLLKAINQKATHSAVADDDDIAATTKGPRLLNYDLRLLQRWCSARSIHHVVVCLAEGEGTESDVLGSLITLLHSWSDRLRFTLLLGVSSSVNIFADRLPRSVQKMVRSQMFSVAPLAATLDQVLEACVTGPNPVLLPGPSLSEMLHLRQQEHVAGVESFVQSLKYACMSHLYGNPLSVFLIEHGRLRDIHPAHFEALRRLPSFRRHIEELNAKGLGELTQALFDQRQVMLDCVREQLFKIHTRLTWAVAAMKIVQGFHERFSMELPALLDLYVGATSGELPQSKMLRELSLRIKLAKPDAVQAMVEDVRDTLLSMPPSVLDLSPDHFQDLSDQLMVHAEDQREDGLAAHSSKPKPSGHIASKRRNEFEQLRKACCDDIAAYFEQTLSGFEDIFPHEIVFYDLKAPHRDAFNPKARLAVERALSSPQDYLGCACCTNKGSMSASQPPTSILYQLYLESGALINMYDLWSAFAAVLNEKYEDEQLIKGLFFKSLAELRNLGFIKPSRKKIDHVSKIAWRGL